jgi:hypothetical protein
VLVVSKHTQERDRDGRQKAAQNIAVGHSRPRCLAVRKA